MPEKYSPLMVGQIAKAETDIQPPEDKTEQEQRIADLLMPWEEYAKLENRRQTEYWTEVFRGSDNQQLAYFASQHVFQPDHPMFVSIDTEWHRFTSETEADSAVVLHEGNFPVLPDKDQTIRRGGESAYVRWLAQQDGIPTIWPEPSRTEEVRRLQQHFSDDEIVSFYCLRAAYQWHRLGHDRPPIAEYLAPYLPKSDEIVRSSIRSVDDLLDKSSEIVGERVNFERANSLGRLITPRLDSLPLNRLARDLNHFRDMVIIEHIVDIWQAKRSIFMAYGNAHLIRQKPALEALIK